MSEVRVATFNIRNGRALDGRHAWPFRRRRAAAAIDELGADVVGLQEVYRFQERSLLRRLPRYRSLGAGRTDGRRGERNPILYDPDAVTPVTWETRWYGADDGRPGTRLPGARFPRIATLAVLATPSGAAFQVACTHLDARSADRRRRSLEQLAGWLDPALPRVVLGDLNAEPGDHELAPLVAAGLRDALPAGAGGTNHDFSGRLDGRRIDHVFVSGAVEVAAARVAHPRPGGRLPSDHWPVVAELRLPG